MRILIGICSSNITKAVEPETKAVVKGFFSINFIVSLQINFAKTQTYLVSAATGELVFVCNFCETIRQTIHTLHAVKGRVERIAKKNVQQ